MTSGAAPRNACPSDASGATLASSLVFLARRAYLWAGYSAGSSVLVLILFFLGASSATLMARCLFLGVLVGWMGSSVVAMKLLASHRST